MAHFLSLCRRYPRIYRPWEMPHEETPQRNRRHRCKKSIIAIQTYVTITEAWRSGPYSCIETYQQYKHILHLFHTGNLCEQADGWQVKIKFYLPFHKKKIPEIYQATLGNDHVGHVTMYIVHALIIMLFVYSKKCFNITRIYSTDVNSCVG